MAQRASVFLVSVCLTLLALTLSLGVRADTPIIHVDASHVTGTITPWLTGACIEDVNHEIYGGLYDQKIFGESFEEPPRSAKFTGWTVYGESWQPDGQGGCRVGAQAGAKLVRDGPVFSDGQIDADVKTPANSSGVAGLLVRVRNAGIGVDSFDGYEISLSSDGHQMILGKHQQDFHRLATAPVEVAPGAWHHLHVVLVGPRIQVTIDGAETPSLDYTDPDALPAGKIALRNWQTAAAYRNVRINAGDWPITLSLQSRAFYAVSGMWDAIVAGNAKAQFQQDSLNPFNGRLCQKITHGAGAGKVGIANRGLNRWGIAVRKGQTFAGRIYLRAENLHGLVTVALQSADGRVTYATETISRITAKWSKYPFTLNSRATDPNARFAVWIEQPGTLWADQAVLLGTGTEQFHHLPIRADIANALIAEHVTFLRYGGTMVNVPGYRWKEMIGDPDKRPPYAGNWYPYSTNGFGIFDFLYFCEAAHLQSAFAINIEESAQDCADLADYLTAPISTPWGHRRAADGHQAPYSVQYLEIGNEESLGGDDPGAYRHYAERFRVIARAIHSRNPHLKLVCAAWWRPDSPNMESVFRAIDGEASAWDLHVGADDARSGDATAQALTEMQQRFHHWNPSTHLKAVIFEENGGLHTLQRALGHATTLNATRSLSDFVLVDCAANCLQPWHENDNGWDQGQIFFTPDHVWAMPPATMQQMAAQTYEPLCVSSNVSGSPDLSVSATRSRDARTVILSVVNTSASPITATVALTYFSGLKSPAEVRTLAGLLNAVNPPNSPPRVRAMPSRLPISARKFAETFPAHSFTVVKIMR